MKKNIDKVPILDIHLVPFFISKTESNELAQLQYMVLRDTLLLLWNIGKRMFLASEYRGVSYDR